MIPILYDKNEVAFTSNGLGRLRDCISCIVTEERNGIYECDFEYPMDGAHYDLIQIGRIIGVTHDETDDIQPFDITSFEKPIDGIVTFHCTHISYRQSYMTVTGSNINSLSAAFTLFGNATPVNTFNYWTDKSSTGYLGCLDGTPRSVRQVLGGVEGSILDIYGGEYEWDRWTVKLWANRGKQRDFAIRYGVNMLDYNEELDSANCYSSCIPYWTDGETTVVGDKQTAVGITPSGRELCVPLDVSEKFEDQPTKAEVEQMGASVMSGSNPTVPTQNITVSFIRLQDMDEFADYESLLQCKLCDTIKVIFPDYNSSGNFKIVKTVWNALTDKYDEMELGDLSITLAEALNFSVSGGGGSSGGGGGTSDYTQLNNKPQINGVTLTGNLSSGQLGVANAVHTHTVSQITDFPTLSTVATSGNYNDLSNTPALATVATSGNYNDLSGLPTFATVATSGNYNDLSNLPALATVATSGNYNDLSNKPTITPNVPYCTCATAAGTKAKTTTIVSGTFTADDLVTGAQVLVKFTNSNTVADPTLKIGSITAKTIKRYGTTAPSTSAASSWNAGSVIMFTYDGTYWQMTDFNNTTYSSMTVAEYEAGTGTTARIITPARLKGAIEYWDAVTSVNSKTGAVTLNASDVGALADTTTYVSSFNGNTGAVTYTAPVTSVNSKTGAVSLTASDVGALPDTTTIPSKLSDLTNDLIYDLGTVTPNDGVFSVSADDVTAITNLWNDGYCALKLTVNSKDYYAYKERMITYNSLSFMGFVAVEADILGGLAVLTGKVLVGINSNGIGAFVVVPDITDEDIQTAISGAGLQEQLVSGTNIKTINNTSLLGSGNISVGAGISDVEVNGTSVVTGGVAEVNLKTINNEAIEGTGNISITGATQTVWYGTCSTAVGTSAKEVTTTTGNFVLATGNMVNVLFTYSSTGNSSFTLNVDSTGAKTIKNKTSATTGINDWQAGEIVSFIYDGTNFLIVDGAHATTDDYGYTMLSSSTSSTMETCAATPLAVKTAYDLADTANTLASAALPKIGGEVTGDVTLKADAGQPSPSLIFQRGTLSDNYNDWLIQDRSGYLYFDQRGNGSTQWSNMMWIDTSGGVHATKFSGYSLADACAKSVDGSISTGSTSVNLPTSQAVASFVEGKGYLTSAPVTSVNSKTGAVTLTASDIGALSTSTTYVSSVNGNSGAVTGIQTTGNLVTSVSSASTDTEYPSAKCLYNYTKTICQGTGTDATLSLTAGTITQVPLKSFTYTDQVHLSGNVSGTDYGLDVLTHGLYKISASVHYSTASGTTAVGCYVRAGTNGATFANATEIVGLLQAPAAYSNNAAIVTKLVELQANDRLYLGGRSVGANGTANPDNVATYLCVEFVKAL